MTKKILQILLFLALILLIGITNVIPVLLIHYQENISPLLQWLSLILYLAYVFSFIALLWKTYQKYQPKEREKLQIKWKDIGMALLFYLAGRIIAIVGIRLNQLLNGQASTANDSIITGTVQVMKQGFLGYTIIFLLTISIFGPIIEELIFRGFGSQLLFSGQHKILTGLITSAIFSLLHASSNVIEVLIYFGLGAVLYLAFRRRNDIKDAIIVHIINNGLFALAFIISIFAS